VIGGEGSPAGGGVFKAALLVAVGVKTAKLAATMTPLATIARISQTEVPPLSWRLSILV
jgi:hypothetical protein